jgi:protein required for attachment to host cells
MRTVWVLVADEAIARILEKSSDGRLAAVEEITDPDAHAREGEFQRAPHGRRGGPGTGGANATVSAADEERHQHAQVFAGQIAERLLQHQRDGRFAELHIAAAPRMLGYLRPALAPTVAAAVVRTLDKQLVHESEAELARRLFAPVQDG